MPGRVLLVFRRQLGAPGERRIEDGGVGFRQQQAGRIAGGIALDLATRRVRRVFGVADGAQGGAVQDGAVVEMQDEDRRVGRSEEHTSELQSLMRISYAVFCLKKKQLDSLMSISFPLFILKN